MLEHASKRRLFLDYESSHRSFNNSEFFSYHQVSVSEWIGIVYFRVSEWMNEWVKQIIYTLHTFTKEGILFDFTFNIAVNVKSLLTCSTEEQMHNFE